MSRKPTIVNYYGLRNDARCFYCPKFTSKHGMWAYRLAAADYQDLIDHGWRRLGNYLQKLNNSEACCPSYTIRCDAADFHLAKSHKKVLKNFNQFLQNGKEINSKDSVNGLSNSDNGYNSFDSESGNVEKSVNEEKSTATNESSASEEIKMITSNPKVQIDIENALKLIEADSRHRLEIDIDNVAKTAANGPIQNGSKDTKIEIKNDHKLNEETQCSIININTHAVDAAKEGKPQLKAKFLRQQRRAEKQMTKMSSSTELDQESLTKKVPKNTEKTLKALIDEMPTNGKHKLKLTLVNIDDEDFERTKQMTFDLYVRYQTEVHNDPPADMLEFNNFICKSPIKYEKPDDGPQCGYGTFHQQYWLDDTLIAVGVMDIMPRGISSVYFFYDPDYSFLTLGTYGTLREVEFIQNMNKMCPQIRGYYIGLYIPTVPKMLYKGKLQPSYLLCPEKCTWHLLNDDLLKLLEKSKYARFNPDPMAKVLNEFDSTTDLNNLRLLVDSKLCLTYNDYKQYKNKSNDADVNNVDLYEYGKAVGKNVSSRLYLVI